MKAETQAAQRIASAQNIVLICHVSPDGDAIGSLLGLGLALKQGTEQVTMVCPDLVPDDCHHLPHWETIIRPSDVWLSSLSRDVLLVSLDCSAPDRLGNAYDAEKLAGIPIVNIDHHPTNLNFGQVNWVEPTAAATAQMLVSLIGALNIPLTVEIATCLLHGILSDTLGFRTSNTTGEVLRTAIQLMDAGASLSYLTDRIFNHRPLGMIRIWSQALQEISLDNRILSTEITQSMRKRVGYEQDGDAGLVNFVNTTSEADIAVVFCELQDGQIAVSLRSAVGFDVSRVALELGGGGHAQAAGCTLPGPLGEVKAKVLPLLQQARSAQVDGT